MIPDESLLIYPNPTDKDLKIRIDNKQKGKIQIRLLDVLGSEISQQVFDKQFVIQEFSLDIRNLSQGVYWVEIADSKEKQVRKIVKE